MDRESVDALASSWTDCCRWGVVGALNGDLPRSELKMAPGVPCSPPLVAALTASLKTWLALGRIDARCFLVPNVRKSVHSPSKRTSSKSSRVSKSSMAPSRTWSIRRSATRMTKTAGQSLLFEARSSHSPCMALISSSTIPSSPSSSHGVRSSSSETSRYSSRVVLYAQNARYARSSIFP